MTKRIKRHRWQPDDDDALRDAVAVVFGGEQRHSKVATWSAVAGRMLPGVAVSPAACRARIAWLERAEREEAEREEAERIALEAEAHAEALIDERVAVEDGITESDGWARAAALMAEYEEDAYDRINSRLDGVEASLADLQRDVTALLAMWR